MKKLALLLFILPFSIYSQDFKIDSFISRIKIDNSGIVHVNENIFVHFLKEKRGIFRDIPYKFSNDGKIYTTKIEDVFVVDKKFEIKKDNGNLQIKIGDKNIKLKGDQYYDLSYKVDGPFITDSMHQEFYWNITGNDWQSEIGKTISIITFPEDYVIDSNSVKVFLGEEGSRTMLNDFKLTKNKLETNYNKTLAKGEGITVAIKLPKDYIPLAHTMTLAERKIKKDDLPIPFRKQLPFAGLGLLLFAGIIGFWKRLRGSSEKVDIIEKPYPPLDLTPAEVGAFHDHIVHDRDVISLLPYWGNQGYVKIKYNSNEDKTYIIKLKDLNEGRPPYENYFFNAIFSFGNEVALEDIKNNFYEKFSETKSQIKKEIVDLEMYDENYRYWFKSWRMWVIAPILFPLFLASFIFGYWLVGIMLILCIIATIVVSSISTKVSEKGQRVSNDLKGFLSFLKNGSDEKYSNIIKEDANYFDKVYPYAVAFGLDKKLVEKVRPYVSNMPYWYVMSGSGNQVYHFSDFSKNFTPKEITKVFSSYPHTSSSSSGSSSGGGFSGGGFGGGGGGSW